MKPKVSTFMEAQLNIQSTTKATIIQNIRDVFNTRLSITPSKNDLVKAYLNLVASKGMPGNMPTTNQTNSQSPKTTPKNTHQRQRTATTNWNIRRLPGTETIEFKKPFNGNAYTMVKAMEACLRQAVREASPPISILAGWWWSPLSSNFTITLAGCPNTNLVHKYREAILKPFGPNIFNLVPNEGQTRLAFTGVPIYCHKDSSLPTSKELLMELGRNLPYCDCGIIEGPVWTKAMLEDSKKEKGAFTMILSDPNRKLGGIIWKPAYMFGSRLTVHFATRFIPFKQCARCHMLSHTTNECHRPADYVHCHICGQPCHTAAEHRTKCPNVCQHRGLLCNCPQKCFNCVYANRPGTGHLAIDESCPLKKNMWHTPLSSQTSDAAQPLPSLVTPPAPPSAPTTKTPARVDDL
jgi:hypothetical protein